MNGNPAMEEVFRDALDRIDKNEPLADVQKVIVREWFTWACSKRDRLELKSQRGFLTDTEYADLAAIRTQIEKLRPYV